MRKRIISICVRAFVSLALIAILLYIMRGNYAQIWDAVKSTNLFFLFLALAAFLTALVIASIRLKLIVDAQNSVAITIAEAVSLTLIGYFFNNFLPTSIGGDVTKAYYLSRKNSLKLNSYTSVFVDRAIGLVTMIFMAAVALLFAQGQIVDKSVRYIIYGITVCAIVAICFLANKKFAKKFSPLFIIVRPVEEKLRKIYNAIHHYKNHTNLMIKSLVISVVSQIFFFISIGVLAVSIGSFIPPIQILLRMPIISTISMLPSINGLGVRETSTVVFFGPIIGKENALAVGILWLALLFVVSVMGGLIYAFSPQFKMSWGELKEGEVQAL